MKLPVYLDYPSTNPCDPRVVEAMLPYFTERFGHPASRQHLHGAEAEEAVTAARRSVAELLRADPEEIVFTSGGTESDNLALRGAAYGSRARGEHLVTTATEHRAILDAARRLENEGFRLTYVPVSPEGRISPRDVAAALTDRTTVVSFLLANHETGVLQPLAEVGALLRGRGVAFHVNAVQAAAWLPLDVDALGADLVTLSAHKMYGPKGVGALYARRRGRRVRLTALLEGGGHERGLRPGTLPVPLVVGLGRAAELCRAEHASDSARIRPLRDLLWRRLSGAIPDTFLNGHAEARLPNVVNASFAWVEAESLLLSVRQKVSASSGSGCTTNSPEPSYILRAMGLESVRLPSSVRFGLGRFTTEEEVVFAAAAVAETVQRLRALSPR